MESKRGKSAQEINLKQLKMHSFISCFDYLFEEKNSRLRKFQMQNKLTFLEETMEKIIKETLSFFQHCKQNPANVTFLSDSQNKKLYIDSLVLIVNCLNQIAQLSTGAISNSNKKYYEAAIAINKKKMTQIQQKRSSKGETPERKKVVVARILSAPRCSVRDLFEKLQVHVPKVSVSAYFLFYLLKSKELETLGSTLSKKEKHSHIAEFWKQLSDEERKEYTDLEAEIRIKNKEYEVLSKQDEKKLIKSLNNRSEKLRKIKKQSTSKQIVAEKQVAKSITEYFDQPSSFSSLEEQDLLSNSLSYDKTQNKLKQFQQTTDMQV